MHVFPAAYHAIFHENERRAVAERTREFVVERFAQPPVATSLLEADKFGYTWEEHERLKLRGGPQFPVIRAAMKTGGRMSKGIDLGWRSGFDSGLTLDYVYENKPGGSNKLGRAIDKAYLEQHRLARHSAAQSEPREAPARADRGNARGRASGPHPRYRGGRWTLRPRNDASARARSR